MRIGYADPPYPGMSHFYKDHPDYGGEVDHAQLLEDLASFDGWCLHTASTTLIEVVRGYDGPLDDVRVMAWVKPFASFKKHVAVAFAWEPVLVKPARPRPFDGYTDRAFLLLVVAGLFFWSALASAVGYWLYTVIA